MHFDNLYAKKYLSDLNRNEYGVYETGAFGNFAISSTKKSGGSVESIQHYIYISHIFATWLGLDAYSFC